VQQGGQKILLPAGMCHSPPFFAQTTLDLDCFSSWCWTSGLLWLRFVKPPVHGDYPEIMRKSEGKNMPKFSGKQSKQLVNSFDFLGV